MIGKAVANKNPPLPAVYALALSPAGDRLAVIGRSVVMTDPANGARLYACRPVPHPAHAAFSPDGATLAVKSTSGRIVLLRAASGDVVADFKNSTDWEGAAPAYSACGRYLVDASWQGHIVVRDTLRQLPDQRHAFAGEMIVGVLASRDRAMWAFVHQPKTKSLTEPAAPAYITVWTWPLTACRALAPDIGIGAAALSPDGQVLAVADDAQVQFLRVANGTVLQAVPSERCKRIRWSPDGTLVAFVQQSSIAVHAFPSCALVEVFEQPFAADACFAPDNAFVAVGGWQAGDIRRFERN